ncbi:MAG: hydantoinase/oxoprolinase family protein [Sumerlaeia bacterium]
MSANSAPAPLWRVWIDTGGTFTDCIAIDPAGAFHRAKVLSHSALRGTAEVAEDRYSVRLQGFPELPDGFFSGFAFRAFHGDGNQLFASTVEDSAGQFLRLNRPASTGASFPCVLESPEEAPLLAARLVTRTPAGEALPIMELRLATTRGTNALLERKGTPPVFFVTEGFRDLLRVGDQRRPDIFALAIEKPEPLHGPVVEVPGRLDATGAEIEPLNVEALRPRVRALRAEGHETAAVALLHSYRNPAHEDALAAMLREEGFDHVSLSSHLSPLIQILPRAQTAVVNAYLAPIIGGYLDRVGAGAGRREGSSTAMMTSAGGLVHADRYQPKDSLLSGPAGGVAGMAAVGRAAGFTRLIGFDMGGTSTDVSRYADAFDYVFEHRVGDALLSAPALAIETVAAGGGSICRFDGDRLLVGPESAGASPGPACYGAGGPLTITDANLLLGRLDPEAFPFPVSVEASSARIDAIRGAMEEAGQSAPAREALAAGFLRIANERMADTVRRISLRKGYDPASHALVSFGGAGGQHACALAGLLAIRTVLSPADAGLLSAYGVGLARFTAMAERQILRLLAELDLAGAFAEADEEAIDRLASEGIPRGRAEITRRIASLRFLGQDATLAVEWSPGVDTVAAFRGLYAEIFGHCPEDASIEAESLRVVAKSAEAPLAMPEEPTRPQRAEPLRHRPVYFAATGWSDIPVFERGAMTPGGELSGPALVFDSHSALLVEPGWAGRLDGRRTLVLTRERTTEDGK